MVRRILNSTIIGEYFETDTMNLLKSNQTIMANEIVKRVKMWAQNVKRADTKCDEDQKSELEQELEKDLQVERPGAENACKSEFTLDS